MSPGARLTLHAGLWRNALRAVWARRHSLMTLSLTLWVPWRVLVPHLDTYSGFQSRFALPLAFVVDPLFELFFAGAVFVVISEPSGFNWKRSLTRSAWLAPRFWLLDIKISVWGLAAPLVVLYAGTVVVSTIDAPQSAAYAVVAATLLSVGWTFYIMLRYMLAHVVMVAERRKDHWQLRAGSFAESAALWLGSGGVSTGWSLRAGRMLIRGHLLDGLLISVAGQIAMSIVFLIAPSPENGLLSQIVNGAAMSLTTVWWSLLWQFGRICISDAADQMQRSPVAP